MHRSSNGGVCNNAGHTFTVASGGHCNERLYMAQASGAVAGSVFWDFDEELGLNFVAGENVAHTYNRPGFYRVLMVANYDDGMGGQVACSAIIPDTIYAVANFDYDGVCSGLPVQFYDLSTYIDITSITQWQWNFGDPASGVANQSSLKDPVHIFSGSGVYVVSLEITTTVGCTAIISQEVEVYAPPSILFATPDTSCEGTALRFLANADPLVTDIQWDFGDPSSGDANTSTLRESYHAFSTQGDYLVSVSASDIYGCTNSFTQTITVTSNDLAGLISPAGTVQICEGDQVALIAPGTGMVAWAWNNGLPTQSISVSEAGAYMVTLTDLEGCVYSPPAVLVDVIPAPQGLIRAVEYNELGQPVAYTYDTLFTCFGEGVYLETPQEAGMSYLWSSGDTDNNTAFTEVRGGLLPVGQHLITLEVTDISTQCSATTVFVIVVYPVPATPIIDTGGGALCAGVSTTLSIVNTAADVSYFWNNGTTGTTLSTTVGGSYWVTAFNQEGCRIESEVTVISEGPDISLVPNGCHTRCAPDTLCLPDIPGVVSYQWMLEGTPIPLPGGGMPQLVVTTSGTYTLQMEDIAGCVQVSNPLNIDVLPGFGTLSGSK
ncbi:MAG: PKD domain-containing protein [Saprospiraceae bacterium]